MDKSEPGLHRLFNFLPSQEQMHDREIFLTRHGNIGDPRIFDDMTFPRFQNYIRKVQDQIERENKQKQRQMEKSKGQ